MTIVIILNFAQVGTKFADLFLASIKVRMKTEEVSVFFSLLDTESPQDSIPYYDCILTFEIAENIAKICGLILV